MVDAIKKYNKIIISVIAVLAIFAVLPFIVKKGNNILSKHDRKLVKYDQYQDGDELIDGTDYVTFDAYFLEKENGETKKVRGKYLRYNDSAALYIELHVFGDVELKNAKIQFANSNVRTSGTWQKNLTTINPSIGIPSTGGTVSLKPSITGATLNNKIVISENVTNDLSTYGSDNKVILSGTVVKPNGDEVEITKEVKYNIDWYFEDLEYGLQSNYSTNVNFPYREVVDCRNGSTYHYHHEWTGTNYKIKYSISSVANYPFIKSANFEAQIPDLNGYDPVSVTVSGAGITYNYDSETQKLTVSKEAVLDGTLITKKAYDNKNNDSYYNYLNITIEYPREVENASQTISLPASVYYEIYKNNLNGQIDIETTAKKSHVYTYSYIKPIIRTEIDTDCGPRPEYDRLEFQYNASIGSYSSVLKTQYINKTGLIKTYEGEDTANAKTSYGVSWNTYITYFDKYERDSITKFVMTDRSSDTASGYTLNGISNYKTIRIYGLGNYLGSSGYAKLINNQTDEVIHIFTALDWNDTYTFEENVSSIRIETSELVDKTQMRSHWGWADNSKLGLFTVYATKEINHASMKSTYDYETFKKMYAVNTKFSISAVRHNGETDEDTEINSDIYPASANLMTARSAKIEIKSNYSAIDSTKINNTTFTISTGDVGDIVLGYKDAEYLISFPSWILDAEINSITSSKSDVKVVGYEKVIINGLPYIKIMTQNPDFASYKLTVDVALTPDIRKVTGSGTVSVYATNPSTSLSGRTQRDIYDVDGDGNTEEYQNYDDTSISIVAPNEIITTATINYKDLDGNKSTVVSPMVADVNPLDDDTNAEMEIGITNNSQFPTKDVKIIGKLGFEGNTYQIGDGDLGSEFDVTMSSEGITVPDSLASKTTVYYSDQAEPTDDITATANNWKTKEEVTDFNAIKTYMIVIDDYQLPSGSRVAFKYGIKIPETTANLNKKTFFNHGVYYNIVAEDEMIIPSYVGGGKLGIRIARRYDVNLTDLKIASERPIAGSKYLIKHVDNEGNVLDQKILTTNENGQATAKNLYAGELYEISQLSVKTPYVLDENTKKFSVTNDANDQLVLTTEGDYKQAVLANNHLLNITLENETRYTVVLKNTDLDTDENIEGASFKLTGKGYESGVILTTNTNGEYVLNNLYINERYTIDQVRNDGYLKLKEAFVIDIFRNETTGEVEITLTKVPTITDNMNRQMYSNYCSFTRYKDDSPNSSTGYYYTTSSSCTNSGRWLFGSIHVDLTEFKEQYQLSYDVDISDYNKRTYIYTWIMDDKSLYPGPTSSKVALPTIVVDSTSYNGSSVTGSFSTNRVSKKVNNVWENQDFMGGQEYDIVFFEYNGAYYSLKKINNLQIKPVSGLDEQVATSEKTDVALVNNQNVLQSIQDSDNQDSPVLTVHIKSKKIPTYTLEITKVDAETNEPLAGAQYLVKGAGLPSSGKYITTDENGKATIELYKRYNYDRINDIDYSEIDHNYTVEEALAPIGYLKDDKVISFNVNQILRDCTEYRSNFTCDLSQENITYMNYNSDGHFVSNEYDADSNTMRVVLQDYPIVKITKTDAETGEVLPNTLFAVYSVETVGGVRVETPAVDANGVVIGDEIEIDGKSVRVVVTNENGNLNLNLPAGQYKLKEIQAADQKYEVDTAVYYFGVGETVPHQEAGINLLGGNIRVPSSSDQYNTFRGQNGSYYTSDGGYMVFRNSSIIKYDANNNQEWSTPATYEVYESAYFLTYYDRPGVEVVRYCSTSVVENCNKGTYSASYGKIVEVSDGYYVSLGGSSSDHDIVIKLDKDGNKVWQSADYKYGYQYLYYGINDYQYQPTDSYYRDENTAYYSSWTTISYVNPTFYKIGDISADADGNLLVLMGYVYNSDYETSTSLYEHGEQVGTLDIYQHNSAFRLDDGTYIYPAASGTDNVTSGNASFLIKYDKDTGKMLAVVDYQAKVAEGIQKYMDDNNLTGTVSTINEMGGLGYPQYSYIGAYDDGSLLLKMYYTYDLSYNDKEVYGYNNGYISFYLKLDKDYNVVYLVPTGLNGVGTYMGYMYYGTDPVTINNETGGFTATYNYLYLDVNKEDSYYSSYDFEFLSPMHFDVPTYHDLTTGEEHDRTGSYLVEYDGMGHITNAILYGSYSGSEAAEILYGDNYFIGNDTTLATEYYKTSDGGYILAFDAGYIGEMIDDEFHNYPKKIRLASGELRKIGQSDEPLASSIIIKYNSNNEAEWIKELKSDSITGYESNCTINGERHRCRSVYNKGGFTDGSSYSSTIYPQIEETEDGHLIMPYKLLVGKKVFDPATGVEIVNDTDSDAWVFLEFELSDEVTPSGPEAYTLNIQNKRKEYKITATSNIGGNIKVTKPDGTDETINNGTLETVKYDDDNVNTITITPEAGYVISSVKVNGDDASYTVNEDGSITLNQIKNIKENKSINVTYEYGKSTVIVKHYLKDTTESVFSDEILTGTITSPYVADPKSSELYSIGQENGELVLPDNMEGTFKIEPQTVIFYYVENEVELRVNYYIDGTDTELAPTNVERKVIGSDYQTAPLDIEFYALSGTLGEPKGKLTRDVTEVTYLYQELTESTITIRYVDKDSNRDIIDPIVKTVTRGEPYTTDDPVELPVKYRYTSVSGQPSGNATDANIEVIYYYEVIPFNISVDKKINSVLLNGEKQTITDGKNVSISPKKKDNLIVYYEIEVKNTGDIPATFKVVEGDIPGFEIYDKGSFEKVGNNYELNVELEPGDSKTYKIGYKWNQKDYGISTNKVEITEVTGKEGYPELDEDDNKSTATVETKIPAKDVIPDIIIIPDTVDKIITSIMLFIGSLVGIITSLILIRKKRMN